MTTPKTSAPEWAASQAAPYATVNEALRYLEQGARFYIVKDKDLVTPPGAPASGDAYIVAANGGGWSAFAAKDLAFRLSSSWAKVTPEEGVFAWVQDENLLYYYDGAAWAAYSPAVSLTLASTLAATGTPVTNSVGYLGAPQNLGLDSGNVTLALTDSGGHVYHTDANARDLTIPANGSVAFPIGTVIAGVNENAAGVVTLKITTDTLRWGSSTGQRTIAANATFTLLKVAATVWRLTGDGIT